MSLGVTLREKEKQNYSTQKMGSSEPLLTVASANHLVNSEAGNPSEVLMIEAKELGLCSSQQKSVMNYSQEEAHPCLGSIH